MVIEPTRDFAKALVKGDINHLDGRVIVYSKIEGYGSLSEPEIVWMGEKRIVAVYSTIYPEELPKSINLSRLEISPTIRRLRKAENNIYSQSGRVIKVPMMFDYPIEYEGDVFTVPGDILFVGDFTDQHKVSGCVYEYVNEYNQRLQEQLEDRQRKLDDEIRRLIGTPIEK